ncbi:MAG: cation:proton antiporter, partial [Pseudobdellovibrionaceae bacterium]
MHEQPSLFLDLIIVLGSALSVATFFHYLKLPLIVGFIGAGLIIGPSGFNLVQSLPQANMIAEIGIIFLMFALGLDFSVRKTKEMRNEVFWLGGLQVVATIAVVSFILHQFLGLSSTEALLASFAVAMSSTAMTLKILEDNRDTNSPQGRPAMGLALA